MNCCVPIHNLFRFAARKLICIIFQGVIPKCLNNREIIRTMHICSHFDCNLQQLNISSRDKMYIHTYYHSWQISHENEKKNTSKYLGINIRGEKRLFEWVCYREAIIHSCFIFFFRESMWIDRGRAREQILRISSSSSFELTTIIWIDGFGSESRGHHHP